MANEMMNISEIRNKIDSQIEDYELDIPGLKKEVTEDFLNSDQFNKYLQDQVYCWAIRSYLVNAKLQEQMTDEKFDAYLQQLSTEQGREQLGASIILASVPLANDLPQVEYMSVESEEIPSPILSVVTH